MDGEIDKEEMFNILKNLINSLKENKIKSLLPFF